MCSFGVIMRRRGRTGFSGRASMHLVLRLSLPPIPAQRNGCRLLPRVCATHARSLWRLILFSLCSTALDEIPLQYIPVRSNAGPPLSLPTSNFSLSSLCVPYRLVSFLPAFAHSLPLPCGRSRVSLGSIGVGTWEASSVSTGQRAATISSIPRLRLLPQFLCSCHAEDLCGHNTIHWPQCTRDGRGGLST